MKDATKDLAAKASRGDERLGAEDLIANELASAILSDPLNKIRHICEALFLLSEDEKQAAHISKDEEAEVDKIYTLLQSLQNNTRTKIKRSHSIDHRVDVNFSFSQDEADKFLDWFNAERWRVSPGSSNEKEQIDKALELKNEDKPYAAFLLASRHAPLSKKTYERLKNEFVSYAMPKAVRLMKKLMNQVSSSSFEAALDRLKG